MFVVCVLDTGDFGRLINSTRAAFVATWSWIGIDGVGERVVSFAIRCIERIEEIVEACASKKITDLIECNLLWVDQRHGVRKVQIRLAIEEAGFVSNLVDSAIDRLEYRPLTQKPSAEVGEEDIQVIRHVGLRCEFSNAETVSFRDLIVDRYAIKCAQAKRCCLLVAICQLKAQI